MGADATLQILIDIQTRLDDLTKARTDLAATRQEASSLGDFFKLGFGLGTGMQLAQTAVNFLKETFTATVDKAAELKNTAANLNISTDGYQVLSELVKKAGGNVDSLTQSLNHESEMIVQARNTTSGAAGAFRQLGLDVVKISALPVERQFEAIAKAIANSSDQQAAWGAAAEILGMRNIPQLRAALQELAKEGYDKVSESAKGSAAYMSVQAIAQLSALKQSMIDTKNQIVGIAGETLADLLSLFKSAPPLPNPLKPSDADIAKLKELQTQQSELFATRAVIARIEQAAKNYGDDPALTDTQKREWLLYSYVREIHFLEDIIALRKKMPLDNESKETPQAREAELLKYKTQLAELQNQQKKTAGVRPSDYHSAQDSYDKTFGSANVSDGSKGKGVKTGVLQWVTQAGTATQQLAKTVSSTLGTAVDGISNGIYGWITKTQTFGDTLRNIGSSVVQTMLRSLIQMGIQMLVMAAIGKGSGAASNPKDDAKVVTKGLGALFSSIMSLGPIAGPVVFAAAIVAMIALVKAMTSGFRAGGYTGDGDEGEVAGQVHRKEFVVPADVTASVGVGNLYSMLSQVRNGRPSMMASRASGFMAGRSSATTAVARSRPDRHILIVPDLNSAKQLERDPNFNNVLVRGVRRRRGEIMSA